MWNLIYTEHVTVFMKNKKDITSINQTLENSESGHLLECRKAQMYSVHLFLFLFFTRMNSLCTILYQRYAKKMHFKIEKGNEFLINAVLSKWI
jgi:hypothetical protein